MVPNGSFREERSQSGTDGPIIGPPVPTNCDNGPIVPTTVLLFRQRSQCPENGPNVPTKVLRIRQQSQGYDNGPKLNPFFFGADKPFSF
ncbi:unnamed protein product [Caenorhabditis nigoni]